MLMQGFLNRNHHSVGRHKASFVSGPGTFLSLLSAQQHCCLWMTPAWNTGTPRLSSETLVTGRAPSSAPTLRPPPHTLLTYSAPSTFSQLFERLNLGGKKRQHTLGVRVWI